MPKLIIAFLAAVIFISVGVGPASAQTPLDPTGQLSGYVPASQGMAACARYMNKRVWLYPVNCALLCTIKEASTRNKGFQFDAAACEITGPFACKANYDRALARLDQGTCQACLDQTAQAGLYPTYRDIVSTAKSMTYCDASNSVPFADGIGSVSLNKDINRCMDRVMRSVIKATKCLNLVCHRKTADALFWNKPINNAACEDQDPAHSCRARFEASSAKITGCPPCLDAAHRTAIFQTVQDAVDLHNGDIYCAN